jgi:hypothetical protein
MAYVPPPVEYTPPPAELIRSWWRGRFAARPKEPELGPAPEVEPVQEPAAETPEEYAVEPQAAEVDAVTAPIVPEVVEDVDVATVIVEAEAPVEVSVEPEVAEPVDAAPPEAEEADSLPEPEPVSPEVEPIETSSVEPLPEEAVAPVADGEATEVVPVIEAIDRPWLVPWLEADDLLRSGQVEAALAEQAAGLTSAIAAHAKDDGSLVALARDLPGLDEYIVSALSTLAEGEQEATLLGLARAALFDEAGLVEAAVQEYQDMIVLAPESLAPQVALARLFERTGKTEQARVKYNIIAAVCELRGQAEMADQLRALARAA